MMTHRSELADQDIEELAEELWTLAEEGGARLESLRRSSQVEGLEAALAAMQERGLVRREGDMLLLSETGRALAERQVRRHRLAETLFTTVLEVRDEASVNRTACVIEHVLDPGLTDSICAFLGHPRRCPHGKPIPPGSCCRTLSAPVDRWCNRSTACRWAATRASSTSPRARRPGWCGSPTWASCRARSSSSSRSSPRRCCAWSAPVKAPFSWPNSSD